MAHDTYVIPTKSRRIANLTDPNEWDEYDLSTNTFISNTVNWNVEKIREKSTSVHREPFTGRINYQNINHWKMCVFLPLTFICI